MKFGLLHGSLDLIAFLFTNPSAKTLRVVPARRVDRLSPNYPMPRIYQVTFCTSILFPTGRSSLICPS